MYVLDTNTLIYFFKGKGRVAERMFIEEPANIGIPAIVLFELETGISKSASPRKRSRQLKSLLQATRLIPFSVKEAKASALIRAHLEKRGIGIGPLDVLIAGTAVANQGVLVSHNLAEFERIDGLNTEDWY
ncbi:MAG: type II toxin-antitoxin system VapC family toxin [Gammaproteobacteria bacterium]|nr:MAG: type II toxin-antitoxin system VapC family toxin [Gammaproteobacteria bacterium]